MTRRRAFLPSLAGLLAFGPAAGSGQTRVRVIGVLDGADAGPFFNELRNYDSNVVPVGGGYVDDVAPRYFNNRKTTIYGGSSEVQRNVLAKAMLGL